MAGSNIGSSLTAFSGGVAAVANTPMEWTLGFYGTWAMGDKVSTTLTNNLDGSQAQVGAGDVTGKQPIMTFVYDDKVYVLYDDTVAFSALTQPTVFNDPNASGNGLVQMSDFFGTPMTLLAVGHYQGRLVFVSRETIQIWNVATDPAQWSRAQTLSKIGTVNGASCQAIGDLDFLFLADSGVRSLQVRDSSLNAYPTDTGSPIDLLIQAAFRANNFTATGCCSTVEPSTNSYWLSLFGNIYTRSFFPSSKIIAWSTFKPTYEALGAAITPVAGVFSGLTIGSWYYWTRTAGNLTNGTQVIAATGYLLAIDTTATASVVLTPGTLQPVVDTAFTPVSFDIFNGSVYCRALDGAIYLYDRSNYDGCTATVESPFLDNKAPATRKNATGIDLAYTGLWDLYATMDLTNKNFTKVQDGGTVPTFDQGSFPFRDSGTHFKFKAVSNARQSSTLGSLILHYEDGGEKS